MRWWDTRFRRRERREYLDPVRRRAEGPTHWTRGGRRKLGQDDQVHRSANVPETIEDRENPQKTSRQTTEPAPSAKH